MHMLDGKIALITGGGRGIGRAIACAFAAAGAQVALTGRNLDSLEQTCALIAAQGGQAYPYACDVVDSTAVRTTFAQVRAALGPIDILVNNAGITASVKFIEMGDEVWDHIMRVNATGPFLCCKAAVPDMMARGSGRIINIASIAGLYGIAYSSAYSASKHALIGLTRSLALELERYHITVNALCPGWVETDMLREAVTNIVGKTDRTPTDALASILALTGQQRSIMPEEVAAMALRFADPQQQATGQIKMIDTNTDQAA